MKVYQGYLFLGLIVTVSIGNYCFAGKAVNQLVEQARKAAPLAISEQASIVVNGKTVVQGSNGWTCMPQSVPGSGAMCNDGVWQEMMMAIANKKDFKTDGIGISYMLLGDPEGAGVSNSDPYHPNPKQANDYVEEGPHLMILVPKELLKGITDDPKSGGPYVMWKDTPYAHIMVPVTSEE